MIAANRQRAPVRRESDGVSAPAVVAAELGCFPAGAQIPELDRPGDQSFDVGREGDMIAAFEFAHDGLEFDVVQQRLAAAGGQQLTVG